MLSRLCSAQSFIQINRRFLAKTATEPLKTSSEDDAETSFIDYKRTKPSSSDENSNSIQNIQKNDQQKNFVETTPKTSWTSNNNSSILSKFSQTVNLLYSRGFIDLPVIKIGRKIDIKTPLWHAKIDLTLKKKSLTISTESSNISCSKQDAHAEAADKLLTILQSEYGLTEPALHALKKRKPVVFDKKSSVAIFYAKNRRSPPLIDIQQINTDNDLQTYSGSLEIRWPKPKIFCFTHSLKSKVEDGLYAELFQHLVELRYLEDSGTVIPRDPEREFGKTAIRKADQILINDESSMKIDEFLQDFTNLKMSLEEAVCSDSSVEQCSVDKNADDTSSSATLSKDNLQKSNYEEFFGSDDVQTLNNSLPTPRILNEKVVIDIFTGQPLSVAREPNRLKIRSLDLEMKWDRYLSGRSKASIDSLSARQQLPIYAKRDEILKTIAENRVVLIKGETGCGKTTQIPQYIFEDAIKNGHAADCNIIVTQPRRISTIAVAKRIADERLESIGNSVGYRIRLHQFTPRNAGGIVFTTPGMLAMQRLSNDSFEGISHVIIDEIHERDLYTDFMLVSLKKIMEVNTNLKLILMSASFGAEAFRSYFDNCATLEIEGRTFPVKEYFLDDIQEMLGPNSLFDPLANHEIRRGLPRVDVQAVISLIKLVHEKEPPGAILVFLPKISDIRLIERCLLIEEIENLNILTCHSRLPIQIQQKVFERSEHGFRKVVLATNIAETSITINDVRYVINTGIAKNVALDPDSKTMRDVEFWASKASQIQRKGRAGRVSEGICYHIFPSAFWETFDECIKPEIQESRLSDVALLVKSMEPDSDPAEFLNRAIDPPSRTQVEMAVNELRQMNYFDENGKLTNTGICGAKIFNDPGNTKALLYSIMLKCPDPLLSIVSFLDVASDFFGYVTEEERQRASELKQNEVDKTLSDHLMFAGMFDAYMNESGFFARSAKNTDDIEQEDFSQEIASTFAANYFINQNTFQTVMKLRKLFADRIYHLGLSPDVGSLLLSDSAINEYQWNSDFIKSALMAGLHRQLFRLDITEQLLEKFKNNKRCFFEDSEGRFVYQMFGNRTVQSILKVIKQQSENGTTPPKVLWLAGSGVNQTVDGSSFTVRDLTLINNRIAFLFSGFEAEPVGDLSAGLTPSKNFVFTFSSENERDKMLELKTSLDMFIEMFCARAIKPGSMDKKTDAAFISCHSKLLDALKNLLS